MRARASRRLSYSGSLVLQLLCLSTSTLAAPGTLSVVSGISLTHPANWSVVPSGYANALKLINVPADQLTSPAVEDAARILITTETRLDHSDAVERLGQIGAELRGGATFLAICGWPAVQGRNVVEREQRGQEPEARSGRTGKVCRVTTAVAVGSRIVRFQGALDADAPTAIADEMDAIARSLQCGTPGDPGQVEEEIDRLRSSGPLRVGATAAAATLVAQSDPLSASAADVVHELGPAEAPANDSGVAVLARSGAEVEIAASANGQFVVVATNAGFARSADGGQTFPTTGGIPMANCGDPSLAVGQSGTFYYAFINATTGCASSFGNATGILASTNNTAQAFTFRSNAVTCPATGAAACFPDQEHIAADRVNAGPGGGDQVYSVWRNFDSADQDPAIVCSTDSGMTWTAPLMVAAGFVPRVTVGQDGFVYVVYLDNSDATIMVQKYSSCATGLTVQPGFPRPIATITGVACPVPGLDRCNFRNRLTSYTAAVDDTNANHIYVAYADETVAGNEHVFVRDSTDGGTTWSAALRINANVTGRRFMPWTCTLQGAVRVGWYDRRAAVGAASNDLTDYYCGSASRSGANLVRGTETRVTAAADPQCASGWPCATDNMADSEQCMPTQPQPAGRCCFPAQAPCPGPGSGTLCPGGNQALCPINEICNTNNVCCSQPQAGCMGTGSGARCDFSDGCGGPGDPGQPGEQCQVGRGCPKYGDYNGIACAAGRVLTAWASATPAQPAAGIYSFFDNKLAGGIPTLVITKADAPDPVLAGSNLTYTITVTNNGPPSAMNLVLSDSTPPNTTFVSAGGGGFTCAPPIGGSGALTCTRPFLAIGAIAVMTFVVRVNDLAPDQTVLSNTAMLTTADTAVQSSNTTQTLVINQADLEGSKLQSPAPSGGAVPYVVSTTNHGPNQANNIRITDTIPSNTRFVSLDSVTPGAACSSPVPNGSGSVQCTWLGFTPVDAIRTVQFTVRPCESSITNTAHTESETVDPDLGNNDPSVTSSVPLLVSAPTITAGARPFSAHVSGISLPDPIPNDNCVHLFDCGRDRACGNGDDTDIGKDSASPEGKFVVNLGTPLRPGLDIYAKEVCCNLMGPVVHVPDELPPPGMQPRGQPAPVLQLQLLAVLAALLGCIGIVTLWLRNRKSHC